MRYQYLYFIINANCVKQVNIKFIYIQLCMYVETYLGASQAWKTRYTTGHARDERDPAYRHATTRAEYIWQLKDEGKTYSESWRIIDRASRYNPITKRCNLCLKEKVYIIFHRNLASLNKRVLAEFYQPCLHRFQTFLAKA